MAITAPIAYWTFDNEQGQAMGNYDGIVNDQGGGGYHLYVDHYTSNTTDINPKDIPPSYLRDEEGNFVLDEQGQMIIDDPGHPNQGQVYFQNPAVVRPDGTAYEQYKDSDGTPAEHYQTSGALFPGAGKAYHMEGGITYQYYDTYPAIPDDDIDPQRDAFAAYPQQYQFFSYRDRLEPESTTLGQIAPDLAGAFDSTGDGNGTMTYSFWLNIKAAGAADSTRFFSNTSFVIGRGSGGPLSETGGGGFGGEVSVRLKSGGGTVFSPYRYGIQVRNDCNGESGCTNGIRSTGDTAGDVDVKPNEWHHWVVQYDMTDVNEGKVQIWLDGGLLNSGGGQLGTFAGQQTIFTGMGASPIAGRFRLNNVAHPAADPNSTGNNQFPAGQKESGDFVIDDLAVWSGTLLTDADVYAIFSQGLAAQSFTPGTTYDVADTDRDGDVDTADLTTMFQNFTGAEGSGKSMKFGDTDMDGDVDTADLVTGFQHFTGALDGLPNNPDLVYDPTTGNVKLYADGANVGSFNLQSAGQFSSADFSDLAADTGFPSGPTDNTASAIGWVSGGSLFGTGFDGPAGSINTPYADLGNILPTGLDEAGLTALLTNKAWAAPIGGGPGGDFDLVVQVPEPGSLLLLALGTLGLAVIRRKLP